MPGKGAEGGRGPPFTEALLDQMEFRSLDDTNHRRMVRRLHPFPEG